MKLHELKIKKEYLDSIKSGAKTFEIRKNDRDFQVGDVVNFIVIDERIATTEIEARALIKNGYETEKPSMFDPLGIHTNFKAIKKETDKDVYLITYVLKDIPQYGLDKDYCIFGIKRLVREDEVK